MFASRKIKAAITVLVSTVIISACADKPKEQTLELRNDAGNSIEKLSTAHSIQLKAGYSSLPHRWSILVDEKQVAESNFVSFEDGKYFSLVSPKGGYMGFHKFERDGFKSYNKVYDYNRKQSSTIAADAFSMKPTYRLKNSSNTEIAKLEEGFSYNYSGVIRDGSGKICWKLSSNAFSLGSNLNLEKVSPGVNVLDAIHLSEISYSNYLDSHKKNDN